MIRLLILVMVGAIALALSYFMLKSVPMFIKMLTVGGGLAAAFIAVGLQGDNPFYMPFLAIVGVALIVSLIYTKILEKQKNDRLSQSEEKRTRRVIDKSQSDISGGSNSKAYTMESIESGKGEHQVG